jgi:hypothetical protein
MKGSVDSVEEVDMSSTNVTGFLKAALAAFALAAFLLPAGCGGGGEAPKKDDKKGGSGKGEKKGDKKGESKGDAKGGAKTAKPGDDPDVEKKELIKDQFKGVLEEYWQGNSKIGQLASALEEAEKALAALPRTSWNEDFELHPSGLNNARVQVTKEMKMPETKAWAFGNLDKMEEGKQKLQALLDLIKAIPRDKLVKNKNVDLKATYDEILKEIPATIAKLETLSELVKRTPPAGEINFLEMDAKSWTADEGLSWSMANGALQLTGKGKYSQITALHYYFKDIRLKISFQINEGGFDIHLRSLPGTNSAFQMGISKEQFAEASSLTFVVAGNHMRIEDPEGAVLDEFDVSNAPAGGGISFFLRQGAEVVITEMVVEGEKK